MVDVLALVRTPVSYLTSVQTVPRLACLSSVLSQSIVLFVSCSDCFALGGVLQCGACGGLALQYEVVMVGGGLGRENGGGCCWGVVGCGYMLLTQLCSGSRLICPCFTFP